MAKMGAVAFDQTKAQTPASTDAAKTRYVRCVAQAIAGEVTGPAGEQGWEVTLFEDDQVNAFALPGGKIGVYTGLLKAAKNQDQLATVIGHEVAHVIAQHGNERVSTTYATQTALSLAQALGDASNPASGQLMGLLGVGAQVGILLPYSRTQESEADLIGLDLMAKAGFDPAASVALWRNMSEAGGGQPPELLSTHPANETRIQSLSERIPQAQALSTQARAAGKRPSCS
jgi:predicted Zn-dependent protease